MKTRATYPPTLQFVSQYTVILFYLLLATQTCQSRPEDDSSPVNVTQSTAITQCPGEDCRNTTDTPETQCNNADGWNLKGSEWGCCGNYVGCCTYASFICYLHDAMCKCCDMGGKLCGPDCKPENECFQELEDSDEDKLLDLDRDHLDIKELENTLTELQNDTDGVQAEKPSDVRSSFQNDNPYNIDTGQNESQHLLNNSNNSKEENDEDGVEKDDGKEEKEKEELEEQDGQQENEQEDEKKEDREQQQQQTQKQEHQDEQVEEGSGETHEKVHL